MCYLGCFDQTPNFPLLDLAQGPHTFLGAGGVNLCVNIGAYLIYL